MFIFATMGGGDRFRVFALSITPFGFCPFTGCPHQKDPRIHTETFFLMKVMWFFVMATFIGEILSSRALMALEKLLRFWIGSKPAGIQSIGNTAKLSLPSRMTRNGVLTDGSKRS